MVAKEPEEASSGPRDNNLFRINGHLTLAFTGKEQLTRFS